MPQAYEAYRYAAMLHHDNMELMEWSQMTCCCLRCSTHWSDFHQRALWPSHLPPSQSSPHDFVQLKFFRKTQWKKRSTPLPSILAFFVPQIHRMSSPNQKIPCNPVGSTWRGHQPKSWRFPRFHRNWNSLSMQSASHVLFHPFFPIHFWKSLWQLGSWCR